MSAEQRQTSGQRRPQRGRRNNSGRGGRSNQNRNRRQYSRMPRSKPKKATPWERFLHIITFGFAGKPAVAAYKPAAEKKATTPARPEKPSPGANAESGSSERRKPHIVEVTSGRLYVGNLSYDAAESDLSELFSGVGTVRNAEVVYNRRTHRSKGYAFVQMQSVEEARRAVTELHDKDYMGRKLVVSGAKQSENRESEDDSGSKVA